MSVNHLAIRTAYEQYGIEAFYQNFGDRYRNPHEAIIFKIIAAVHHQSQLNLTKVLDLASGSGEVTLALRALGYDQVDGIEPYAFKAYFERTGKPAEQYRFEEIEQGFLSGRSYTTIVCSFALHLVEPSRLPTLLYQLSRMAPSLLVITPHKRPEIRPQWGWRFCHEMLIERVRGRCYQSHY